MFQKLYRWGWGEAHGHVEAISLSFLKGKDKVKLFLSLTKHHAMKVYWGVKV
jgi:hypothetical protein